MGPAQELSQMDPTKDMLLPKLKSFICHWPPCIPCVLSMTFYASHCPIIIASLLWCGLQHKGLPTISTFCTSCQTFPLTLKKVDCTKSGSPNTSPKEPLLGPDFFSLWQFESYLVHIKPNGQPLITGKPSDLERNFTTKTPSRAPRFNSKFEIQKLKSRYPHQLWWQVWLRRMPPQINLNHSMPHKNNFL